MLWDPNLKAAAQTLGRRAEWSLKEAEPKSGGAALMGGSRWTLGKLTSEGMTGASGLSGIATGWKSSRL